jgi:hypothetical protein
MRSAAAAERSAAAEPPAVSTATDQSLYNRFFPPPRFPKCFFAASFRFFPPVSISSTTRKDCRVKAQELKDAFFLTHVSFDY